MVCFKCHKTIKKSDEQNYGLHFSCFQEWFEIKSVSEFDDIVQKNSTSNPQTKQEFNKINNSFFQGKFKKYSAKLENKDYLLKVEEKDFPELPAAEFLCNQIAETLKLNIPYFYLINFHDLITFVTKNFISRNKRMTLHHIYHYFKENDSFDAQTLIKIIEDQTGRISEVERFVELCLFDALIGNHDRHGRNLAFIEEKGTLFLSPFYDNPTYIGIEDTCLLNAQHNPKGKIATSQTPEPSIKDYVIEFKLLGFEDLCLDFYKRICLSDIFNFIKRSFISEKRQNAFTCIIDNRYWELKNEIGQ